MKQLCRHCRRKNANRSRGLCSQCFRDVAVRELYPVFAAELDPDDAGPDGTPAPRPDGTGSGIETGANNRGWGAFLNYEPPGGLDPLPPELQGQCRE